jgi:putative Ca2+/H+ antiporter (TMEM165/GDT1 family)
MYAFFASVGIVALAEIGDKTQLLTFVLAARFRKPWPILLGIFVATLLNHALAGALGSWVTSVLDPSTLRWVVGVSFLAMAVWALVPDKPAESDATATRYGIFGATLIAFFLVEIGDKTQVATVVLAAHYQDMIAVVLGTTLGMMIANAPVAFLGDRLTRRIPVRAVHLLVAVLFAIFGAATLLGAGRWFGF